MKRLFACMMVGMISVGLFACGGSKEEAVPAAATQTDSTQTQAASEDSSTEAEDPSSEAAADTADSSDLEMITLEATAYEEEDGTASVSMGYPADEISFSDDTEDSCTFTNEGKDYEIDACLYCDNNYTDNFDTTKERYEGWQEINYSGFDGYGYVSDGGDFDAFILLESTDYEDIYLYCSYSPNGTEDIDVKAALDGDDAAQKILNSISYGGISY